MNTEFENKLLNQLQVIQYSMALNTYVLLNELKEMSNLLRTLTQVEIISIARNLR